MRSLPKSQEAAHPLAPLSPKIRVLSVMLPHWLSADLLGGEWTDLL